MSKLTCVYLIEMAVENIWFTVQIDLIKMLFFHTLFTQIEAAGSRNETDAWYSEAYKKEKGKVLVLWMNFIDTSCNVIIFL